MARLQPATLAHQLVGDDDVSPVEGHLPRFTGATTWLNSDPLTPAGLRGRVVLKDFWTYTCINWLRTFPYVRAWVAKYADHGLTVIGAHTPEFGFEHDLDSVTATSRDFGVTYPIAVDSDYGVWSAFANHFWPAVYASTEDPRFDGPYVYPETGRLPLNGWAPIGPWALASHAAVSADTGARIVFRFQARQATPTDAVPRIRIRPPTHRPARTGAGRR